MKDNKKDIRLTYFSSGHVDFSENKKNDSYFFCETNRGCTEQCGECSLYELYNSFDNLEYIKNDACEDYAQTPISVLRYISKLEELNKPMF
jgi:radical SAM superfamily enzyme YgiQ (UPF0313 family)